MAVCASLRLHGCVGEQALLQGHFDNAMFIFPALMPDIRESLTLYLRI